MKTHEKATANMGTCEFSWFEWNLGAHFNNLSLCSSKTKWMISAVWCWICQNYLHTLVTLFERTFMGQVTLATCNSPTMFKKIHHLIDMCHLCILLMRIYPSYKFSGHLLSRKSLSRLTIAILTVLEFALLCSPETTPG